MTLREFKINDFLTLKLENNETIKHRAQSRLSIFRLNKHIFKNFVTGYWFVRLSTIFPASSHVKRNFHCNLP
jgi:hypothetical protein